MTGEVLGLVATHLTVSSRHSRCVGLSWCPHSVSSLLCHHPYHHCVVVVCCGRMSLEWGRRVVIE